MYHFLRVHVSLQPLIKLCGLFSSLDSCEVLLLSFCFEVSPSPRHSLYSQQFGVIHTYSTHGMFLMIDPIQLGERSRVRIFPHPKEILHLCDVEWDNNTDNTAVVLAVSFNMV